MEPKITAYMKCLFLLEKPEKEGVVVDPEELKKKMKKKVTMYEKLLKPKEFLCRIYITNGVSIGGEEKRDVYLQISLGSYKKDLRHNSLNKQTCNPDFYIVCEIPCKVPGNSFVLIEVKEDSGSLGEDETIA